MTEPADAAAPARLDEIAAVTNEYAQYAHARSGLGIAAVGAWFVVVFVAAALSEPWGRVAGVWTPFVAMGALVLARWRYQRFGAVSTAPAPARSGRVTLVREVLPALVASLVIVAVATGHGAWTQVDPVMYRAALYGAALTPLALVMKARTRAGDNDELVARLSWQQMLFAVLFTPALNDGAPYFWKALTALFATYGGYAVWDGVRDHLRYRRLERRLAALRGTP